jgi:hypothetical protein
MKSIREELETIIARAEGLELSIDRLKAEIVSLNQQKQADAKGWVALRNENTRLRDAVVGPVRKHTLLAAVNEAIRVGLVPQSSEFNEASAYVFKVHDILVAAKNAKPDPEEVKSEGNPVDQNGMAVQESQGSTGPMRETGWLVEMKLSNGNLSGRYASIACGRSAISGHESALRFARKQDAEAYARVHVSWAWEATEHGWLEARKVPALDQPVEKASTCGDCLLFPCWAECASKDRTCHGFKKAPKGRKKGGRGK